MITIPKGKKGHILNKYCTKARLKPTKANSEVYISKSDKLLHPY